MVTYSYETERDLGPLTATEREQLDRCEAVIARNLRSFVEVGNALAAILEQRLYRDEFPTFESYCREKWDLSCAYAYRQMQAARVVEWLSPIGDTLPLPANEAQARPLTTLPDSEVMQAAWKQAVESSGGKPLTAKIVQTVVEAIQRQSNSEPEPKPTPDDDGKPDDEPGPIPPSRDVKDAAQQLKRALGAQRAREVAFEILGGSVRAVKAFRERYGVRETYSALRRQADWDEKDRISLRTGDLETLERFANEQGVERRALLEQIVEEWISSHRAEPADAAKV